MCMNAPAEHLRASVTETSRWCDEFSSLSNAIRHPVTKIDVFHAVNVITNAARVVALPRSLYICLSNTASDASSPFV